MRREAALVGLTDARADVIDALWTPWHLVLAPTAEELATAESEGWLVELNAAKFALVDRLRVPLMATRFQQMQMLPQLAAIDAAVRTSTPAQRAAAITLSECKLASLHPRIEEVKATLAQLRMAHAKERGAVKALGTDGAGEAARLACAQVLGARDARIFAQQYRPVSSGAVRAVSGLLLFGPSGTGKSMVAQAICVYIGGTFYRFSAADLPPGRGAAQMIDALFDVAMAGSLPAVIFIDECDGILRASAPQRVGHFAGRFERFKDNLLVIGATNEPDKIAPKILTAHGK